MLPTLRPDQYRIGIGNPKLDGKTGNSKIYSDVVLTGSRVK